MLWYDTVDIKRYGMRETCAPLPLYYGTSVHGIPRVWDIVNDHKAPRSERMCFRTRNH